MEDKSLLARVKAQISVDIEDLRWQVGTMSKFELAVNEAKSIDDIHRLADEILDNRVCMEIYLKYANFMEEGEI